MDHTYSHSKSLELWELSPSTLHEVYVHERSSLSSNGFDKKSMFSNQLFLWLIASTTVHGHLCDLFLYTLSKPVCSLRKKIPVCEAALHFGEADLKLSVTKWVHTRCNQSIHNGALWIGMHIYHNYTVKRLLTASRK